MSSLSRIAILIAIVASAVYIHTLSGSYVFDDRFLVVDNPQVQQGSVLNLINQPSYPWDLYRPLFTASNVLIEKFSGEHSLAVHHLTNIALHAGNSILIFLILSALFEVKLAALIALLFAVHPIHVEAVANISGRSELLCHLFGLSALALFLRATWLPSLCKRSYFKNYLLTALPYLFILLSLLSKENGVVYLPLSFFLIYIKAGQSKIATGNYLPKLLLSLAAVFSFYLALRYNALSSISTHSIVQSATTFLDNPLIKESNISRIWIAFGLLGKYIALTVAPVSLSADYSYPLIDPSKYKTSVSIFFHLCCLLGFTALCIKQGRKGAVLLSIFLCGFCVTSNILFPLGTIFAERLAYLPSLAVIGTLIVALQSWIKKYPKLCSILIGIYLCLLTAQTVYYAHFWKSELALFSRQIYIAPQSAKTQLNYATLLQEQAMSEGNNDKNAHTIAEVHMKRALELYPNYAGAHFGLATVSAQRNEFSQAISRLERALAINPKHIPANLLMARILISKNRSADDSISAILAQKPSHPEALELRAMNEKL